MPASTPRQIGGVILRPNGQPFANKSLTVYRDPRATSAQGSAIIADEQVRTTLGPAGQVNLQLVPGRYLGQIGLIDADRYFGFNVPDAPGPFDIADLYITSDVNGAIFMSLQDLVLTARAWAENPQNLPVVTGPNGFSALHWAANAASSAALSNSGADRAESARNEAFAVAGITIFTSVAAFQADGTLTYATVSAGDIIQTQMEDFTYQVLASASPNPDLANQNGVKLRFIKGKQLGHIPSKTVAKVASGNPIYVLMMGQSNAVGASPTTTGSVFVANPAVKVWRASLADFVTPVVGVEPFNPSGSNNAGLDFCNKLAEETGREVRFVLVGKGSTPIAEWTGSIADRTISVDNRPRYVELQTAMAAIGKQMDAFLWIQGEADGGNSIEYYAAEFQYLLAQMGTDGYIGSNTPVVVSQLSQGVRGQKGNRASGNAVLANANIYNLLQIGDGRLRIANSLNAEVQLNEIIEGTGQGASTHFTDLGLRGLGRNRLWSAYTQALDGYQAPSDFGLEMSRCFNGLIGQHLWAGGDVDFNLPNNVVLDINRAGMLIDVRENKTLVLPDFTHPTKYSSALRGRVGLSFFFQLIGIGSCTLAIEAGGTGGMLGHGALYTDNTLKSSITISATGATTHLPHMARWVGTFWRVYRMVA